MQLIGSHDYLKAVQSDDNRKEETLLDWLTLFFKWKLIVLVMSIETK